LIIHRSLLLKNLFNIHVFKNCHAMPLHCLQRGGGLAQAGGGHYRFTEPQTVNSPQKVIRSYTPACAKPLVVGWSFLFLYISI